MRRFNLLSNTPLRFSAILFLVFLGAYVIAGIFAYFSLSADLDERVVRPVTFAIAGFENVYEMGGREALIRVVAARADSADPEDEIIWFGGLAQTRLAGQDITPPAELQSGRIFGEDLGADDEFYEVAVRHFGNERLIFGRSYEQTDEIQETLIGAFGLATIFIVILTAAIALPLVRRIQTRLGLIISTLQAVSAGKLQTRIALSNSGDDLDQMARQINSALDQLEKNVESIRQVSDDIAHDLRTPINRLGIILESANANAEDKEKLNFLLERARVEVRGITQTFNALLRIAQIEAGARRERFGKVNLREIAYLLFDAYQPVAEEHGCALFFDPDSVTAIVILGDRELLTQLFSNLIENAIQYSGSGSKIQLELGWDGQSPYMGVSDDGPGIPAEEHENVIRRFYRMEKSRTSDGSGLGLALVKAICELHKANLVFRDNSPGLAACVFFPPVWTLR